MYRKKQPALCMAKITLHKKKYWKQIKFWRTNTPILFPQINRVKNSPYCRWALVNHAVQWSHIRFSVQEYIEAHTWRQVQLPWMLDKQISLAGQGRRYILISFFLFLTDSSFTLKVFSKSEHHLPSCYWEETLLNNLLEPSICYTFFHKFVENSITGITCGSNWKLPQRGLSTVIEWKNWRGWYFWYSCIVQHLAQL